MEMERFTKERKIVRAAHEVPLAKSIVSQKKKRKKNATEVQSRGPAKQYAMFGKGSLGTQLALLFLH